MEKNQHWFLHVDLDAFFASVEQLDHPEYRGKPVIVGGKPEDKRSVVSTASYEARKFGVHSAMPTFMAYKLCPQGIYVHGRMKRYSEISYQIMSIFKEYSPDVIQMSIDEAFIDLTGTEKLFGPPEETAMKIKAHVKKDTGLTVSIGLATTKYLAKIGSGFNKPDGFYFIKPGTEQEFMLSLPLNKVWGVGEKTLESLKKNGIYTTRDIYEKSYDSLEFLFGKNTGNFLYNIVRGIDVIGFGNESKKHSISAETTFPYDIKDSYTAETQLMDLCHDVFFRLMRENSFSRTVFVKIRYDDFSTVSIQETYENNILTLDSYFEAVKKLFEKKYENGRGIRLLGVGFDNVEKENRPYQQDLFETGNEKKQAVEMAILSFEKKHPEVKIRKARILEKSGNSGRPGNSNNSGKSEKGDKSGKPGKSGKTLAILVCFLLLQLFPCIPLPQKAFAETVNTATVKGAGAILTEPVSETADEDSEALFNWNINDNNVDLLLSGYWLFGLTNISNFSFGNGTNLTGSFGVPVFTQEVDLSAQIMLNKSWFFEAEFADEFEKNTLAMGYLGKGYLKSAILSNRNITMPENYSANYFGYGLGGGQNQAPGLSMHFADLEEKHWSGDFLIRYDMTKTNSATFYGKNSVSDQSIELSDYTRGKYFILPETCKEELQTVKDIYVQDSTGTFKDKSGKKYKKLTSADYVILPGSCKIIFNKSAYTQEKNNKVPSILVTFTDNSAPEKIKNKTGSYTDSQSFAGKIQKYFNSGGEQNIILSDYAFELTSTINSENALVIQNGTLFSPFMCANIYDCGITDDADVFIQTITTGKKCSDYSAFSMQNDASTLTTDFLEENHFYAQIFSENKSSSSLFEPENRFPLADAFPLIYLGNSNATNLELIVRNYSEITEFSITTDAIAGTVQVYINNVLETGTTYNSETGVVTIPSSVSNSDKIYITWQEDASDTAGGALASGAGLYWNLSPKSTLDFAITTRWPVSNFEKYSTAENPLTGFAAITQGYTYKPENFTFEQKATLSVISPNAAQNLLVLNHEDLLSETHYLSSSDGQTVSTEPELSNNITLKTQNNKTTGSTAGTNDSKITGYKIPLSWNFDGVNETEAQNFYSAKTPYWAAIDVKLSSGQEIRNASALELAVQCSIPQDSAELYDIYLQLGNNTEEEIIETDYILPCWKLNGTDDKKVLTTLDTTLTSWQTVTVSLSDLDRALLSSGTDARLIVVYNPGTKSSAVNSKTGTIYFGPYEPKILNMLTKAPDNYTINSYSVLAASSPAAKNLKMSDCYASKITWTKNDNATTLISGQTTVISAKKYIESTDFSSYGYINFDFDATECTQTQIQLTQDEETALSLTIFDLSQCISPLPSTSENPVYHNLSINLTSKTVSIDGEALSSDKYTLQLNDSVQPDCFTINVDTAKNGEILPKGTFFAGNLYYSDCNPFMNAQNYILAEYKKDGAIAKIGNYNAVENPYIKLTSNQNLTKIDGTAKAGITLTNIRYEADFNTDYNGGHKVQTTSPLFKTISFGEEYRFNHTEKNLSKTDDITISIPSSVLPSSISFTANAKDNSLNQTQEASSNAQIQANLGKITLGLTLDAALNQKITKTKNDSITFNTDNYFSGWEDISNLQFSTGNSKAATRNQDYKADFYTQLPFLSLKPQIKYELQSLYENISQQTLQDTSIISFIQPVSFKNNTFTFTATRTGTGVKLTTTDGNYFSDSKAISDSFNNKKWFYSAIPFYDFFDKNLNNSINKSFITSGSETLSYATLYSLSWKRRLFNNYFDLLIPSSSSFDFSREIKTNLTNIDVYQVKTTIINTALNCFGQQSRLNWFTWYESDEFLSTLTGIIKIPAEAPEDSTFTLTGYNQILIYISNEKSLKTGLDFSIDTLLNWEGHGTFIYTSPGKTSFITDGIMLIAKKLDKKEIQISRKEILNITLGETEQIFRNQYEFTHSADFNFLKYYTITTGAGLLLTSVENSASNLSFTLSISGKVEF